MDVRTVGSKKKSKKEAGARQIGRSSSVRHIGSPKEKPTRGELDARVVRGTEEVQKGSRSEVNWTLELRDEVVI